MGRPAGASCWDNMAHWGGRAATPRSSPIPSSNRTSAGFLTNCRQCSRGERLSPQEGAVSSISSNTSRREVLAATAAGAATLAVSTGFAEAAAVAGARGERIRPFHISVPEAELADLRRRIEATRWPERETVDDTTPGRAARDDAGARPLLGERATTGASARRGSTPCRSSSPRSTALDIHFIHVRSKHAERAADDHHPRLARLDHRAAEDHRSADRSDRARRDARRTPSTS